MKDSSEILFAQGIEDRDSSVRLPAIEIFREDKDIGIDEYFRHDTTHPVSTRLHLMQH